MASFVHVDITVRKHLLLSPRIGNACGRSQR